MLDFVSAALRHIRDAEHLTEAGAHASSDQAWHLAGFAHECARKALLSESWIPKLLGHDFSNAGELVVEVAIALDPRAGRFSLRQWPTQYPAVAAWQPDHRYERTGSAQKDAKRDLASLVAQGRTAVDASVVALLLDGVLSTESLG